MGALIIIFVIIFILAIVGGVVYYEFFRKGKLPPHQPHQPHPPSSSKQWYIAVNYMVTADTTSALSMSDATPGQAMAGCLSSSVGGKSCNSFMYMYADTGADHNDVFFIDYPSKINKAPGNVKMSVYIYDTLDNLNSNFGSGIFLLAQ